MPTRVAVKTDKAPAPLPVYSQAIVCNGMVYCSGQVAMHPETKKMLEGGISDRTVSCPRVNHHLRLTQMSAHGPVDSMLEEPLGRS